MVGQVLGCLGAALAITQELKPSPQNFIESPRPESQKVTHRVTGAGRISGAKRNRVKWA